MRSAPDATRTLATDLGTKIRELRIAANMSQKELGDVLGMDQAKVSRLERGKLRLRIDQLDPIAAAFGTSVLGLLDGVLWESARRS